MTNTEMNEKPQWQSDEERVALINAMPTEVYDEMMETKFPSMLGHVRSGFDVPQGWQALVHDLCVQLQYIRLRCGIDFEVTQVKSKLAGLRFYYAVVGPKAGVADEDHAAAVSVVRSLVAYAEHKSYYLCEVCGAPGHKTSTGHWISTLCDKHGAAT